MISEQLLIFPEAEYRNRLRQAREVMEARGVEVYLVMNPENIFYLTGHQTFGIQSYHCCILSLDADPILVVRFLESFNSKYFSWIHNIEVYDDHEIPAVVTAAALQKHGLAGLRIAADDASLFFPPAVRDRLNSALAGRLQSSPGLVEACRAVKSPLELNFMRKASTYTDIGLKAAEDEARPGCTENDVAAAAFSALTQAGSEYVQIQPIVTSGWRSGIPHTTYQRRTLEPGDPLIVELTGTYHRYVAPIMRTVVTGRPTAKVEHMYAVCEEALAAVLGKIRAGMTSGEIDGVARRIIEKAGYLDNWRKRTGYSVGCSFPPDWGEGHIASLRYQDDTVLEEGMVFHIPIAFRDYGVAGVGISETIIVTRDGCEQLGHSSRELLLK
ncbi:Xaa-Pro peptidase family protein [Paenibacillus sp. S150]|uniref:M24 family metallopeptidase n=1 Tax=Paenibacillus sp. S150 TaxID=2749826 RepID=UPI001C5A10BA|nr:Xaa-Pro peptidase family protein [Paenibacillus sp. S150]MBW4082003.1 aminopeptidase P family protein [Paenibacillus sp. S150]